MPETKLAKHSLLIVDSSHLIIERLIGIISDVQNIGKIFSANTYADAVGILKQAKVDILLLDIQLSGKTGFDLLKLVSKEFPETKIIALSNQVSQYHEKLCRELGASFFIDKSKDFDLIPEIIATL